MQPYSLVSTPTVAQVVLKKIYKQFPQRSSKADRASALPSEDQNRDRSHPPHAVSVLRDINLTVRDGEFMVLVGPSGCGKSTLLRLIAGLETVTAGTIQVSDRTVNDLPPKQRDIAMVFQNYALYPHMTVYDNLAFGLRRVDQPLEEERSPSRLTRSQKTTTQESTTKESTTKESTTKESTTKESTTKDADAQEAITKGAVAKTEPSFQHVLAQAWRRRSEAVAVALTRSFPPKLRYLSDQEKAIDQRVRTVAQMLQIEELLDRLPRQLSGGQKQRVALGRAMARNPQVFLMDEPLSNLDAKLRLETRAQIVSLQRRLGITTIYVTHDQTEAMTMGDRIAIMSAGQIQQVATPLNLYNAPANRFVAEFIGSLPMNFLTVQVSNARLVTHPAFRLTLPDIWTDKLRNYDGQTLLLGIRPEHLQVGVPAPKNLATVVERVETLGSDTYITARLTEMDALNPVILQARIPPDYTVALRDEMWFSIPPDKIHLFDPKTTQAI